MGARGGYQPERNLSRKPDFRAADVEAGQGLDQYNQSLVNAPVNQWNYDQNLAYNKLAQYLGLLTGGGFGTTGTSKLPNNFFVSGPGTGALSPPAGTNPLVTFTRNISSSDRAERVAIGPAL